MADPIFIGALAVWSALLLTRYVHMYDRESRFQRWRQWDWFHLVPRGAFFSPAPPDSELWIVVRDFLPDGTVTPWAEVPRIVPRTWWHWLWNPQKQLYKGRIEAARAVLAAAEVGSVEPGPLPPSFLFSAPYLDVLRYATSLRRLARPAATQFGVIEADIITREVRRTVLSAVHDV